MADKRQSAGMVKLVVSVPPAMLKALDARVEGQRVGSINPVDRGTVVRAMLAKELRSELRGAG